MRVCPLDCMSEVPPGPVGARLAARGGLAHWTLLEVLAQPRGGRKPLQFVGD